MTKKAVFGLLGKKSNEQIGQTVKKYTGAIMKLKNSLIISLFFVAMCLFVSCTPSTNKIYTVGDTYELLADDGTIEGTVKLEAAKCLKNSNEQTYILALTYLINPNCTLVCTNQNVFVSCGEKQTCRCRLRCHAKTMQYRLCYPQIQPALQNCLA